MLARIVPSIIPAPYVGGTLAANLLDDEQVPGAEDALLAVFDDLEPTEKLKIYDKGAEISTDYEERNTINGIRLFFIRLFFSHLI